MIVHYCDVCKKPIPESQLEPLRYAVAKKIDGDFKVLDLCRGCEDILYEFIRSGNFDDSRKINTQ